MNKELIPAVYTIHPNGTYPVKVRKIVHDIMRDTLQQQFMIRHITICVMTFINV